MIKRILTLLALICIAGMSFAQWVSKDAISNSKKVIAGIVDSIHSAILKETRVLNIYLPEEYSPDSAASYPVIYLLDGGADEDFIPVTGLVRYFTTPWVNRFPRSIVVGIENTDRRKDFTFATPNLDFVTRSGFDINAFKQHGGSANFISFMETELQPFIRSRYKTSASKTIIGESLAGLLATEILLKKPFLFDTYIIISPSLWWGSGSLIKEPTVLSQPSFANKIKIYLGAGNKAESIVMFNDAESLCQKLKKTGHKNITVHFDYIPAEVHATIIQQAVYNAFKLFYPKVK